MKILIGGIYKVNGIFKEIESYAPADNGKDHIVNGEYVKRGMLARVKLCDEVFEELGFSYYNGWEKNGLTFSELDDVYIVSHGSYDFAIVRYLHEVVLLTEIEVV